MGFLLNTISVLVMVVSFVLITAALFLVFRAFRLVEKIEKKAGGIKEDKK